MVRLCVLAPALKIELTCHAKIQKTVWMRFLWMTFVLPPLGSVLVLVSLFSWYRAGSTAVRRRRRRLPLIVGRPVVWWFRGRLRKKN